jgi:hypothetical protein
MGRTAAWAGQIFGKTAIDTFQCLIAPGVPGHSYFPWGGLKKVGHAATAGATCTDPSSAAVRTVS